MVSTYVPNTQADMYVETPPRTTSLQFRQIIKNSPPTSLLLCMFENEFEGAYFGTCSTSPDIRPSVSSKSSSPASYCLPTDNSDITLENMTQLIATAIELSMSKNNELSSFSSGNASIKYDNKSPKKKNNPFSRNLLNWGSIAKPTTSVLDNGKEELINHGIPVKEIKTTLRPMVVPTEFNHNFPKISLQRPQFARINY
ncbi:hypothetical protein [Parasitella parasitica]|uniref:Uncharacterized protein n=1 Tax=Parasitella parasitica TaxID=35722 RepID=A0A0B7NMS3_9FUNG|nr:hypothetical protein [Parasitella parasitica]